MRFAMLALLVLAAACGKEKPAVPEPASRPPVAAGVLRLTPLERLEMEAGWAAAWLEQSGWEFWGFSLEAGSPGEATVTWSDPRSDAGPLGEISCRLFPGKPLRLVWCARVRPLILGPQLVDCEGCGGTFKARGALDETYTCPRCKRQALLAPEWSEDPFREVRILALGNAGVRVSEHLRMRSSGLDDRLIGARIRRRSALDPSEACDVVNPMQDAVSLEPGTHVFARLFDLGRGSGTRIFASEDTFAYTRGSVRIVGDREGYEIHIGERNVALADYPHPVWEFAVRFQNRD